MSPLPQLFQTRHCGWSYPVNALQRCFFGSRQAMTSAAHGVEIGTPAGQALKKTLKESSLGGFESKNEICFYNMGDLSDLTKKQ